MKTHCDIKKGRKHKKKNEKILRHEEEEKV